MYRMHCCLRAAQETCADLHCARTEHKRGGDATAIGDTACRHDRNLHCARDLRQQGEQASLAGGIGFEESATMPTRLEALGND